jgi:hypothetical protein
VLAVGGSFDGIPCELINVVAKHLPTSDIVQLSLTNRQVHMALLPEVFHAKMQKMHQSVTQIKEAAEQACAVPERFVEAAVLAQPHTEPVFQIILHGTSESRNDLTATVIQAISRLQLVVQQRHHQVAFVVAHKNWPALPMKRKLKLYNAPDTPLFNLLKCVRDAIDDVAAKYKAAWTSGITVGLQVQLQVNGV